MIPTKACPVLIRKISKTEILVFQHPLAGVQLVKGTIEPHENASAAAVRELEEESGIRHAEVIADLGCWDSQHQGAVWSFHLCAVRHDLPDEWVHDAADDGGHAFSFFWHPLDSDLGDLSHEVFHRALEFIRRRIRD